MILSIGGYRDIEILAIGFYHLERGNKFVKPGICLDLRKFCFRDSFITVLVDVLIFLE